MKLFKYEGYRVTVDPEALMLKPFRAIWERDKSEDKNVALQELAYVYFVADPRSDYQYIIDLDERAEAVKNGEGMAKKWKADSVVEAAIEFYQSVKTPSAYLLESTRSTYKKLQNQMNSIEFVPNDDKAIDKMVAVVKLLKEIPDLIRKLDEVEKQMNSEMRESGRMRGQGQKSLAEDGFDDLM
mgnify:CR=1 FL=1